MTGLATTSAPVRAGRPQPPRLESSSHRGADRDAGPRRVRARLRWDRIGASGLYLDDTWVALSTRVHADRRRVPHRVHVPGIRAVPRAPVGQPVRSVGHELAAAAVRPRRDRPSPVLSGRPRLEAAVRARRARRCAPRSRPDPPGLFGQPEAVHRRSRRNVAPPLGMCPARRRSRQQAAVGHVRGRMCRCDRPVDERGGDRPGDLGRRHGRGPGAQTVATPSPPDRGHRGVRALRRRLVRARSETAPQSRRCTRSGSRSSST